jgi:hypothetical protein
VKTVVRVLPPGMTLRARSYRVADVDWGSRNSFVLTQHPAIGSVRMVAAQRDVRVAARAALLRLL